MALQDLNVRLGLIVRDFERGLKSAEKSVNNFRRTVEGVGQDLTQALTVPLAALGGAALKSFADLEKASAGLTAVVGGNAAKAAEEIEKLRVTAQLPGLGFEEAIQASARLQAVGLSADQARATIEAYGNAVARSGGGRAEFDAAILALTQVASKGKVSAEEINQLNERIFEIRPALSSAFGTADSEQLQKLGVSAAEFIAKSTAELAKLERVQGGLSNAFENFGDSVRQSLASLGQEINKTFNVQGIIDRVSNALSRAVQIFKNLDDSTKQSIVRFGLFAAAIGPVFLGFGQLARLAGVSITALQSLAGVIKSVGAAAISFAANPAKALAGSLSLLLNPAFLAVAAAAAIVTVAFLDFKRKADLAAAAGQTIARVNQEATEAVSKEKVQVELLAGVLTNENKTREEKARALNELKRISPEYFGQLDTEKSKVQDVTKATTAYIESLKKQAQLKIAIDELAKVENQLSNLTKVAEDSGPSGFGKLALAVGSIVAPFQAAGGAAGQTALRFNESVRSLEQQRDALKGLVEGLGATVEGPVFEDDFDRTPDKLSEVQKILQGVQQELRANEQRALALGSAFDKASANGEVLADGIDDLLGEGVKAESPIIQGLINQFKALDEARSIILADIGELNLLPTSIDSTGVTLANASLKELKANLGSLSEVESSSVGFVNNLTASFAQLGLEFDKFTGKIDILTPALQTGLSVFSNYAQEGISSMKALAGAVLKATLAIVRNLIQQGVAAAVANALKNPAGIVPPLGLALAAGAGAAAAGLFTGLIQKIGIPALAEGGIVDKPTLALIGEAGPEAVVPLRQDKVREFAGGMGQTQTVEVVGNFRLLGSDLLLAVEREKRRRQG